MVSKISFKTFLQKYLLFILTGVALLLMVFFIYEYSTSKHNPQQDLEQKLDSIRVEQREIKRAQIDLLLSQVQKKKLFNGNVLIIEKGEQILKKSYGMIDFEQKKPLTSGSIFRIGAISKSFTAMSILILVNRKKLSLEDSLYKFYPEMAYPKITIHELLTHTSGLPDYLSYFYTYDSELMTYARNRDIIAWLENEQIPLSFEPGSSWQYSHSNYVVLAGIIEKVSKKTFPVFLQKEVLQPLGLEHTYLPEYHQDFKSENRVFGFQTDTKNKFDDNFLNYVYGGDGIYSNTDDLLLWVNAWHQNKLVSKKILQKAFQPTKLNNGLAYPYGFAWHLRQETEEIYHLGTWLGFKSIVLHQPKTETTLIILSNNSCPVFEELVEIIQKIMQGRRFRRPAWLFDNESD